MNCETSRATKGFFSKMQYPLFTPIRIGGLELPGRLVKSATTEGRYAADGFVTDELVVSPT